MREELDHERRNDVVGRREVRQDELAGHAEERAGAGDDEHEHGRIDRAGTGGFGILGRDAAGIAVHAREKRHDGRQAKREDRRPAPGAEVKEARRQVGDEVRAHLVQLRADQRHREPDHTQQQQRHLHDVGIRYGKQAARRDIEHDDHGRKNVAQAQVPAREHVQNRGPGDKLRRRVADHGEDGRDAGHGAVFLVIARVDQLRERDVLQHFARALDGLGHDEREDHAADGDGADIPDARDAHGITV